jgi:hypothetical protein
MTQVTQEPEDTIEQEESVAETPKPSIPPQKVSRFGPVGYQAGSKFGKGPTGSNPQLKQRPGRAAARGR